MDRLPTELFLAIAGEVPEQIDRLNLLRVCRRWRDTFLEVAYGTLELDSAQVPQLVETLLGNSKIALSVRRLDILHWHSPGREPGNENVRVLVDEIASSPEEADDWRSDLLRLNPNAWLAVLLLIVPNLTSLSWGDAWPSRWVTTLTLRASYRDPPLDARPVLQSLSMVELPAVDLGNHIDYISIPQVVPFLHLPSIRHLYLEKVKDGIDSEDGWVQLCIDHPVLNAAAGTSPVETLRLQAHCNLSFGAGILINSCANLKEFTYQHNNEIREDEYRDFRPRAFRDPLLGQKQSLEVLHLSDRGESGIGLDEPDDEEDDFEPADRWFGSFADFERLWDLRVRAQNLLNLHPRDSHHSLILKDVLPNSLKWLHVAHCDEEHCAVLVDGLLDVLRERAEAERFPHLERIFIYAEIAESSQPQPAGPHRPPADLRVSAAIRQRCAPLQAMCERAGITFNLSLGNDYKIVYLGGDA
ncbi:hypothetical protein BJY00DRAFT_289251 [Aspergillus carlsbadensis]|nr:hypothetical protein BJY00DRAFT_289251 [Aspergillus carlsbadensis]